MSTRKTETPRLPRCLTETLRTRVVALPDDEIAEALNFAAEELRYERDFSRRLSHSLEQALAEKWMAEYRLGQLIRVVAAKMGEAAFGPEIRADPLYARAVEAAEEWSHIKKESENVGM